MQRGLKEILSFFLRTLQQADTVPAWAVLPLFGTPWTVAHQAPLFMEFSRQEYWSELPYPSPGDLPNSEIKLVFLTSPALAGGFFITSTSC